jgi:hypothetical protein
MHRRKLLMMGREDAQNMQSFIPEYISIISVSGWLYNKKYRRALYVSLCYVMLSRLVQRNYRDVGGHGLSCGEMIGEMNFCVTSELSHYLFSPENTEF